MPTQKKSDTADDIEVEGAPDQDEAPETEVPKRDPNGRITRPSTQEIRYEAMRISKDGSLDDFDRGVLTALQWMLGEKKTLRRSEK
jgi:hypothetical protein